MFCPSLKPPFVEGMAQLERLVRRTTSCAQVAAARPLPRRSRWRKSNLSNSLSSRWKTRQMVNLMWNFQVYVEQELWGIVIYSGQLDFWWFLMISDDFWWFLMISGHLFIRNHQTLDPFCRWSTRLCSNCGMVFTESQRSTWRICLI